MSNHWRAPRPRRPLAWREFLALLMLLAMAWAFAYALPDVIAGIAETVQERMQP